MFFDWRSSEFKHNSNEWGYYPFAYRHVISDDIDAINCTLPTIVDFPNLLRQKSWIAIVVSFLVSMYLFVILAIVCDDYLVPAMERLCYNEHAESEVLDEDPMTREEEPLKGFRDRVCAKPQPKSNFCQWTWWVIKYPAEWMLACTIPSARSIFFLSMCFAVLWISMISYLLAWFLTILGYNLNIPDAIMGLTVLAAGTSVPEVASSYIVSKKGYGSMAICNAIGSNTFDIFVCLGLPWLLNICIYQQKVVIDSTALTFTTAMLVLTASILYLGLLATKFVMGKIVGCICVISYLLFLIIACTLEILLNKENTCDIEDPSGFF
ncbi:sodium/potassium/calcium exchanger 3 isoform X3 [Drosophila santomea]|uniref:sodium/potassium/calcium exchanger 3 isoform X3 n=1 Tax=Drosophila santomea TaxID=129105 RepID=UPI001954355F|nr:sodium/potassium/calcium exchanger 3 isoform X3 [Drosophila santomea]